MLVVLLRWAVNTALMGEISRVYKIDLGNPYEEATLEAQPWTEEYVVIKCM
jgi:hypothetical protein